MVTARLGVWRLGCAVNRLPGGTRPLARRQSVECGLKARVAKQIKEHDFPDRKLILDSYTHDLGQLLAISAVKPHFEARVAADQAFEVYWSTVREWNENSRYDTTSTDIDARDLFTAVTDPARGVLTWLKTFW
jgi:hypothetical protein